MLLNGEPLAESSRTSDSLHPEEMAVLMFTSGTTGEPKGVMHSSNSLIACTKALARRFGLDADDDLMVASPVGHMTGYAAVVLLSIYLGGTMVLQDIWEPKHGVSLMVREGVTYTAASTPFLTDICNVVKEGAPRPSSLRAFLCGGAPIPSALIEWRRSERAAMSSVMPAQERMAQRAGTRSPGNRPVPSLSPGDKVTHDKFGLGTVVSADGHGDQAEARIDFGADGVKHLVLRYAPLEKL